MPNAILLHSGGLDSTIVALQLKREKVDFVSLFVNLGQTSAATQLTALRAVCSALDVRYDVIDMPGFRRAFTSSDLAVFDHTPNPGQHVLPLGSLTLLGTAAAYALRNGARHVYVGYNSDDAAFSGEYDQPFLETYSTLVTKAAGREAVRFIAPLLKDGPTISREDLAILNLTYSCIHEGPSPCGVCGSCRRRVAKLEVQHE